MLVTTLNTFFLLLSLLQGANVCIGVTYEATITLSTGPGCSGSSIRLADGDSYNSGRVELCYNESWSTVADVTPDTANVICRQLGFSDAGS